MNNRKKSGTLSRIIVRRKPGRTPSAGILLFHGRAIACVLGRSGIRSVKLEGDGATPLGRWPVKEGYFRADRTGYALPRSNMRPIRSDDGWCDQPDHACYNRRVRLPFPASHETMKRPDGLYDICINLDHNQTRRIRNRGSAVFFHLTAHKPYTAGCIAIAREDMLRLLPLLRKGTIIDIRL